VSEGEREEIKAARGHAVKSVKFLLTNESLADCLLGPEAGSESLAFERGIYVLFWCCSAFLCTKFLIVAFCPCLQKRRWERWFPRRG
jgi:hypothetical protein